MGHLATATQPSTDARLETIAPGCDPAVSRAAAGRRRRRITPWVSPQGQAPSPPAEGDGDVQQQDLVTRYLPLARRIARQRYRKAFDWSDYDDFEGAALEGLVLAARNWRRDGGARFGAYAAQRIHGAISDWRRQAYGPVSDPRYEREKRKRAGRTDLRVVSAVSYETLVAASQMTGMCVPEPFRHEERGYHDTEVSRTLAALIEAAALPERSRRVLAWRMDGDTHDQIGARLGVTGPQVWRLESLALKALAAAAGADPEKIVSMRRVETAAGRRGRRREQPRAQAA